MRGFIVGLVLCEHEYQVNGVRYVVSSHFEKNKEHDFKERIGRCITSDLTPLPLHSEQDKMDTEYACSVAGKEE